MTDAAARRMTPDEFLTWCLDQQDTYELVNGIPVLKFDNGPEMMAGASRRHDRIVVNLISRLRERLRGRPCWPSTADQASRMAAGNIRRPDVTIDCGEAPDSDLQTAEPTVFFEVLSRTTRSFDFIRKANEYRQVATLQHFVLIEPDAPLAWLWTRRPDGTWTDAQVEGLDAALDLCALNLSLPMRDVYEDLRLDEGS